MMSWFSKAPPFRTHACGISITKMPFTEIMSRHSAKSFIEVDANINLHPNNGPDLLSPTADI